MTWGRQEAGQGTVAWRCPFLALLCSATARRGNSWDSRLANRACQLRSPWPQQHPSSNSCHLLQGLTEPNALAAANSIPGLQLALGTGSAIYILRDRKKVGLGRAVAITGAGLLLGTLVGGAVQSWLHVEMLPLWVGWEGGRVEWRVGLGEEIDIAFHIVCEAFSSIMASTVTSSCHLPLLQGFRSPGVLVGEFSLAGICAAVALLA